MVQPHGPPVVLLSLKISPGGQSVGETANSRSLGLGGHSAYYVLLSGLSELQATISISIVQRQEEGDPKAGASAAAIFSNRKMGSEGTAIQFFR